MRSAWSAGVGREAAVCLEEGNGSHNQFHAENICYRVCGHQAEPIIYLLIFNIFERGFCWGEKKSSFPEMVCFLFMKQTFSSAASSLPLPRCDRVPGKRKRNVLRSQYPTCSRRRAPFQNDTSTTSPNYPPTPPGNFLQLPYGESLRRLLPPTLHSKRRLFLDNFIRLQLPSFFPLLSSGGFFFFVKKNV